MNHSTAGKSLFLLGLCSILLGGCGSPKDSQRSLTELEGEECFIIFRRDALGYATDKNGISAVTVESGDAGKLAVEGRLKRATGTWVVVDTAKGLQAIPVNSILSIHDIP